MMLLLGSNRCQNLRIKNLAFVISTFKVKLKWRRMDPLSMYFMSFIELSKTRQDTSAPQTPLLEELPGLHDDGTWAQRVVTQLQFSQVLKDHAKLPAIHSATHVLVLALTQPLVSVLLGCIKAVRPLVPAGRAARPYGCVRWAAVGSPEASQPA